VLRLVLAFALALLVQAREASAHDDPIVTVRVLCNGFNVLDMDAVLGEISDSATLNVDRTVRGRDQIQTWIREQMDKDLRIEIVDIGTPRRLSDGYALSWTARFSRQDWRAAGLAARQASNTVVIHNGRITEWTATIDTGVASSGSASTAPIARQLSADSDVSGGIPELFGIPVTLLLAAAAVVVAGALVVVRVIR
jgi:hypothetical protein